MSTCHVFYIYLLHYSHTSQQFDAVTASLLIKRKFDYKCIMQERKIYKIINLLQIVNINGLWRIQIRIQPYLWPDYHVGSAAIVHIVGTSFRNLDRLSHYKIEPYIIMRCSFRIKSGHSLVVSKAR